MKAQEMFEELGYRRSTDIDAIAYSEKLDGTFHHFEITFDLLEKEIVIGTNMEYVIENDLLQAIIQQAKELGWLEEKDEHFEERQETNLEHYYNDILKLNGSFSLINGKIGICQGICCSRCAFNKDYCPVGRVEWLKKPYKKPTYKLNQFEYDLIQTFDRCKECCLLNEIECLKKLTQKGYFSGIDPFTKVHEILDNCEVIQ